MDHSIFQDKPMKRSLILTMITLLFVVHAFAQKGGAERELDFQRYDSYFEGNNSGLKGKTSYLVFNSQAKFDKIFHPAATMGKNSFLPERAFQTKLVVATVTRGSFIRKYDLTKVTSKNGKLYVWYTIKDREEGSASFNSPLILAVDKKKYSQIVFMEDGKRAGAIPFSKSK